ncbi:MAG: DUF92 domain-containing protein [Nitrososphaerales archaeon]
MPIQTAAELVGGIVLIFVLAYLAVRSRSIDVPGAALGALISFAAFLAGSISWLVIIIAFFGISSFTTRVRYDYKKKLGSAQEKGGLRSWPNTVANGMVAGIAAVAEIFTHQEVFVVAFLGSIAAAMCDTIATEIGLLSRSKPRYILNLRKFVEPGTSGGVSLLGELAGIASALGIAALGIFLGIVSGSRLALISAFFAVVISAILATNFDSFLGSTLQGQNRCRVCGARTESARHHGKSTVRERGIRMLDNNGVNLIATIAAALIAVGLYLALTVSQSA